MASSLFQSVGGQTGSGGSPLMQMLRNDPEAAFQSLMQSNPRFQQFMAANQGKTPQQVAQEHGIDIDGLINSFK